MPKTAWRCDSRADASAAWRPHRRSCGFPHLSNATDFRLLTWADWIAAPPAAEYDFIVLPGSKNTIADLAGFARSALRTGFCGSIAPEPA